MADYESFAFEAIYKIRKGKNKAGKWCLFENSFYLTVQKVKNCKFF